MVAVSKGVDATRILEALDLGFQHFGEGRVQEAFDKQAAIGRLKGHLHLVGHLQSNKVRRAVELFELIHGVDSIRLARAIGQEARRQGKVQAILVQINVAQEINKFGLAPQGAREAVAEMLDIPGIELKGLMTIAPQSSKAEEARPVFQGLHALRETIAHQLGIELPVLSMGMTADYAVAVEEGANLVRIGEGLFGPRQPAGTSDEDGMLQEDE